jgi:rhamnosyltransferase
MLMKLSVIIPTLNAGRYLPNLLERLFSQTVSDKEIIVIDSASDDETAEVARSFGVTVKPISRREFNHGRTRNVAADDASGEYLVFLTQDALPVNGHLLENLIAPLENDGQIAASYGRQIAYEHAYPIEKFIRGFNYPEESRTKEKRDIPVLGVKTFFCSNACAAYRRDVFRAFGGFRGDTIMNEDMEYFYRAVMAGYKVHYAADAQVWHSHNYTLFEQFRRYVDIGVFFSNNPDLAAYSRNETEGIRYILAAARHLIDNNEPWQLPHPLLDSLARFLGYRAGKNYRLLPVKYMEYISMNKAYWLSQEGCGKIKDPEHMRHLGRS